MKAKRRTSSGQRWLYSVCIAITCLVIASGAAQRILAQVTVAPLDSTDREEQFEDVDLRTRQLLLRLRDPATGKIPPNMRARELDFVRRIPTREHPVRSKDATTQSITAWTSVGPMNIAGRTRALAVDVDHPNTLLAGGVSGGVYRSTDGGTKWIRTDNPDTTLGASCLIQDTRPGHHNVWYRGTGEYAGMPGAFGNGIFKSIDSGKAWSVLPSTAVSVPTYFKWDLPFDQVYSLAIDPANLTQDVVYAATGFRIMRTSDGGVTWAAVIDNLNNSTSSSTDVKITTSGIAYATVSGKLSDSLTSGIYRSADGAHWTKINPPWSATDLHWAFLGITPANPEILYVFASGDDTLRLWKYTHTGAGAEDPAGSWEDLSLNIDQTLATQGGYTAMIAVKPDDERVVFIGGQYLYRSTNGFVTNIWDKSHVQRFGWTDFLHADQHTIVFSPNDPLTMYVGNDGGVYSTTNDTASIEWRSLNAGYPTTQFYNIAIDQATPGSHAIIGGTQDQGTWMTPNASPQAQWVNANGGDGGTSLITHSFVYCTDQIGWILRCARDAAGNIIPYSVQVDPGDGRSYKAPYLIDPSDSNTMFDMPSTTMWRTTMLASITGKDSTHFWKRLTHVSSNGGALSALACSTRNPSHRLFYGASGSAVFRIDSANTAADPIPIDIGTGKGFPPNAYPGAIAVDPVNGDHALLLFNNYNVQSVFFTSDGGSSWVPVSGNLEQYPDGSGNGPACISAAILSDSVHTVYLIGTSSGLFSTHVLNGMSTVWEQEGAATIGHALVMTVTGRSSDGFVAVGTFGCGVFTGILPEFIKPPARPKLIAPHDLSLVQHERARLVWSNDRENTTYTVQVALDAAFTQIKATRILTDTTLFLDSLARGTKFWWRVNAAQEGGATAFVDAWSFTMGIPMGVPDTVSLVSPPQSQTPVMSRRPRFVWLPSARATVYHLQVAGDTSFVSIIFDDSLLVVTATTPYAPVGFNESRVWRVRAGNEDGWSAFTSPWEFTIGLWPQGERLLSPADGASMSTHIPIFTWGQYPGATGYEVQVTRDSNFYPVGPMIDTTLGDTTCFMGQPLGEGLWFWHVRAGNGIGWGAFSDAWRFTTGPSSVSRARDNLPMQIIECYPDPFSSSEVITFSIQHRCYTVLNLYDAIGREIASLDNSMREAGLHTITFERGALAAGIYFLRLSANGTTSTRTVRIVP